MGRRIGIIGKTTSSADRFLTWFIHETNPKDISRIRLKPYKLEMINGDEYRVVPANNSSRGHRFQQLFIEVGADRDFINCVALPSLVSYNAKSEDAAIYFSENHTLTYEFYVRVPIPSFCFQSKF
jgi:hypothetical protein